MADCRICAQEVTEGEKAVECEVCQKWFHSKCCKIPDGLFKMIKENENLLWLCDTCNSGCRSLIATLSLAVNQQKQVELEVEEIKTEMSNLKDTMKEVDNMKKELATIEELKNGMKDIQALMNSVAELKVKLQEVESLKEDLRDMEEIKVSLKEIEKSKISAKEMEKLKKLPKEVEDLRKKVNDTGDVMDEVKGSLKEVEKSKTNAKEMEKLKKLPKEVEDLKKKVNDTGDVNKGLKDLEKKFDEVKKDIKVVAETKGEVDNKLKIIEDLKKGIKEMKDLTKGVNEVESMKEQLQELKEFAASQSDTAKEMEKFVEVKCKRTAKEMKGEMVESLDIEQRKFNVIVHGVEEVEDDSVDNLGCQSRDHAKVKEIMDQGLKFNADIHVVKVFRIGKPRTDRPRLLKVELKTVEGKMEILRRAKNLRNCEGFQKVFIVPDLTRKQQEVDKELRDQVKKFRSEGVQQVMIKKGKVIKNEGGTQVVLYCPTLKK
jgi:myosin heavy subunit